MADPKWEVTIGNAKYEVTAPDESTAWKWANQTHSEKFAEPYDIPAGVKSAMNVGQALSFGFGDEIAGALGADKNRYRATLEQFKSEYPKSAMLGTVAGSLAIPGAAGKMFANAPYQAAMATGLATGALQGAGDSPDNDPNSLVGNSARGGLFGMTAAPVLMGMAKPVGSIASALGSKLPGIGANISEDIARRRIVNALEQDSIPLDQLGRNQQRLGPEARIADAGGENVRSLLDFQATLPGKTKNDLESVIRNRISTRPDRLDNMVYAVNDGMGRAKSLTDALTAQQKGVSGPLYNRVHSMNVNPSPQLVNDLEAAKKLGAFGEAEQIALAEGIQFTLSESQQRLGAGQIGMRDLDRIKQGIDSLIEKQTDAVTGKVTTQGRALLSLKNRILGELDTATNGAYAAARDAYAGPAAMKSAIDKGRSFWGENAESISSLTAGMAESEKAAFRVGAAERLREMVGEQTGQNRLLDIWKNRNTREKLQSLLGNDVKYAEVEQLLRNEGTLKRLESLGANRNSKTAVRQAMGEDESLGVASDAASLGLNLKTGNWPGIAGQISKIRTMTGTPEPVRDAIGNILLKQYAPPEIKALMETQEALRRLRSGGAASAGVIGGKNDPLK